MFFLSDKKKTTRAQRMLQRELRRQSYRRVLPHHIEIMNLEQRLRRVATVGMANLFNAFCRTFQESHRARSKRSTSRFEVFNTHQTSPSKRKRRKTLKPKTFKRQFDSAPKKLFASMLKVNVSKSYQPYLSSEHKKKRSDLRELR